MTPTSYIVLGLLERLGEASAYDLKREATATLGNFWSTPHSQIYRTTEHLAAAVTCRSTDIPEAERDLAYEILEIWATDD